MGACLSTHSSIIKRRRKEFWKDVIYPNLINTESHKKDITNHISCDILCTICSDCPQLNNDMKMLDKVIFCKTDRYIIKEQYTEDDDNIMYINNICNHCFDHISEKLDKLV